LATDDETDGIVNDIIATELASKNCAHERERQLVERAVGGDARAFREIVDRHHPGMYALAQRLVRNPADAEDLVQESFERAFARLWQFDTTYRLSTWLYRIVLNSCRDHLKSRRRSERPAGSEVQELDSVPPDVDPWVAHERDRQLRTAVDRLLPNYSQILLLKDVLGLSFEEIRELTGVPVTGLKIRAIRARERLRRLLGED
jgi:RNA polymerase sigma-70 factor (ECF subfamily)